MKINSLLLLLLMTYAFPVTAELDGAQLYIQNCMVCHADDGTGAMPGVSDLTENKQWAALSVAQLVQLLKEGVNKPGATVIMPAKGGNPELTDRELNAIVLFIRNELL